MADLGPCESDRRPALTGSPQASKAGSAEFRVETFDRPAVADLCHSNPCEEPIAREHSCAPEPDALSTFF
jgi:hypothetical protein